VLDDKATGCKRLNLTAVDTRLKTEIEVGKRHAAWKSRNSQAALNPSLFTLLNFTIEQSLENVRGGPLLFDGFGQFGTDGLCGMWQRKSVELLNQGVDINQC
jgi:hypothetical protein